MCENPFTFDGQRKSLYLVPSSNPIKGSIIYLNIISCKKLAWLCCPRAPVYKAVTLSLTVTFPNHQHLLTDLGRFSERLRGFLYSKLFVTKIKKLVMKVLWYKIYLISLSSVHDHDNKFIVPPTRKRFKQDVFCLM